MRVRIAVPPDCAAPVRSTLNHGYGKAVWQVVMRNRPAAWRAICLPPSMPLPDPQLHLPVANWHHVRAVVTDFACNQVVQVAVHRDQQFAI
ncbi:hypothetical protein [Burkholderia sp. 567]|uniref:hypothetical protein n=1 Tax=Burkholderia sp. 567 TaxID=3156413 RepID=UPI00339A4A94